MNKGTMEIELRPTYETQRAMEMVQDTWDERFTHFMAQFIYKAAKYFHEDLLRRIPDQKDFRRYRKSIKLARIIGLDPRSAGYSVFVDVGFGGARKVDAPKTLLYIRPLKSRLRRPKPEILILEKYNPWTLDSIPFVPKKDQAQIVSRKVPIRTVQKVTQERFRDRRKWRQELVRAGYKELHKVGRKPHKKYTKAVPDVLFEVLRLELGIGGKPVPAWKPAAHQILRHGTQMILKRNPNLTRAITDPEFFGWQHWPTKVNRRLAASATAQSKDFVRRLGVRV